MPNRILMTFDEVISRISEIDYELSKMPKVKAGDKLQAVKYSLVCEKRRLKIRASKLLGKTHTRKDVVDLIEKSNGKCTYCGSRKKISVDHIIPISKGGHDGVDNLQILCVSCNSKKGNRI